MATISPEEEIIIRKRLISQTAKANGSSTLHKLTKSKGLPFQARSARELDDELLRTAYSSDTCVDNGSYAPIQALALCLRVQAEIEELKVTLEKAREERAHKEEYEVLRRLCMEHPARSETRTAIATLEKDIAALENETAQANGVLEVRFTCCGVDVQTLGYAPLVPMRSNHKQMSHGRLQSLDVAKLNGVILICLLNVVAVGFVRPVPVVLYASSGKSSLLYCCTPRTSCRRSSRTTPLLSML
eukprot:1185860-Prorocentrum_minimum.AAC.5